MNRRTTIMLTGMTLLGLAALPQLGFAQSDPFVGAASVIASAPAQTRAEHYPATVLQASRLLDVRAGSIVSPGEVLVDGERIVAAGASVEHPAGAEVINLGDVTLMPGLIDAHVHLFLHPGAEDLQTIKESVPQRTIMATLAARADLMAGFTAERDMGTEGAGSADTAVRNAINEGLIPGPRLRISGNAIDILGGHEDANDFNPAQHVLSNATYANNVDQLVEAIREQFKEGSDFVKIYETGHDSIRGGVFSTPYQYTLEQLKAAVNEAARVGKNVAVHAMGEPGALYAAEAGVVSIDHAAQLGPETMRIMREKQIRAGSAGEGNFGISRSRVQEADGSRDFLCCGFGCRAVPARDAGARTGVDGEVRNVAARGVKVRFAKRCKAFGMGWADRRAKGRIFR